MRIDLDRAEDERGPLGELLDRRSLLLGAGARQHLL